MSKLACSKCKAVKNSQSGRYNKMVADGTMATYLCRSCKKAEKLAKKSAPIVPPTPETPAA